MPSDNSDFQMHPAPGALSIDEFAAKFSICRVSVYRELNEGRLQAKRIGRRTVIARDEADRWFASLPAYA